MILLNRFKKGESTNCTFTTTRDEIKEGDILGYGDNYPCIVLYNPFEGRFDLIEFGYSKECEECSSYRTHEIRSQTMPWAILGNYDNITPDLADKMLELKPPGKFDYVQDISEYYQKEPQPKVDNLRNVAYKYATLPTHQKFQVWQKIGYEENVKQSMLTQVERDQEFFNWVCNNGKEDTLLTIVREYQ